MPAIKISHAQRNIAKAVARAAKRLLLLVVVVLLAYHFTGYPAILRPQPDRTSSPWLTDNPVESILVFAPHPDDETLGCAGVIMHALDQGALVRVVLITNGDGSPTTAHTSGKGRLLAPARYVSLGHIRQDETLVALALLGLEPENVDFLGYPDSGISALWTDYWDYASLFTSRYTKANTSPYSNSLTPNAPYCGLSVANDICSIIRTFNPTHVFLPHPNDAHPDHWGTFALVTYALHRLAQNNELRSNPEVFAYLIHRGDWPIPRLYSPRWPLDPPNTLLRLLLPDEWAYLPLATGDCALKRQAILEHRSQTAIMRMYMLSFVRSNELLAILNSPAAAQLLAHQAKSPVCRDRHWSIAEPVIWDPQDDTLTRLLGGGNDIKAVYAITGNGVLYIMIEPKGRPSSNVRYTLDISNFNSPRTMVTISYGPKGAVRTSNNLNPNSIGVRRTAVGIEFTVPLSIFQAEGAAKTLFIAVRTVILGSIVADRTGWTVLRLSADEPDIFRGVPKVQNGHIGM